MDHIEEFIERERSFNRNFDDFMNRVGVRLETEIIDNLLGNYKNKEVKDKIFSYISNMCDIIGRVFQNKLSEFKFSNLSKVIIDSLSPYFGDTDSEIINSIIRDWFSKSLDELKWLDAQHLIHLKKVQDAGKTKD